MPARKKSTGKRPGGFADSWKVACWFPLTGARGVEFRPMWNFSKKKKQGKNHYDLTSGIFARAVRRSGTLRPIFTRIYTINMSSAGFTTADGLRVDCICNAQSESAEAKACIICVSVCVSATPLRIHRSTVRRRYYAITKLAVQAEINPR